MLSRQSDYASHGTCWAASQAACRPLQEILRDPAPTCLSCVVDAIRPIRCVISRLASNNVFESKDCTVLACGSTLCHHQQRASAASNPGPARRYPHMLPGGPVYAVGLDGPEPGEPGLNSKADVLLAPACLSRMAHGI